MNENSRPTLCLDFDGVCHSYTSGRKGAEIIPDPPVPGLNAFLIRALEHFRICIFSSRSNQPGGIEAMVAWFDVHGMGHLPLAFPVQKPPAFLTLGDRVMLFIRTWPDPAELLKFTPGNQ